MPLQKLQGLFFHYLEPSPHCYPVSSPNPIELEELHGAEGSLGCGQEEGLWSQEGLQLNPSDA